MSVEEGDNFSSHSINSIDNGGKPNLAKIHLAIEKRNSVRLQEKDLGIGVGDSNMNDSSAAEVVISKL